MESRCNCKVCRKRLTVTINDLALSTPLDEIVKRLKFTYGVETSELSLKEHFRHFEITPIEAAKAITSEHRTPINLDELTLERWNLSMDQPQKVVAYIQEKLLCLSIRQIQVVAQEQGEYLSGESAVLNKDQVQNLRILMTLADRFTGISLQANQQQAVRVVQALGYEAEDLRSLPSGEQLNP